jgi:hypothetical protein
MMDEGARMFIRLCCRLSNCYAQVERLGFVSGHAR